MNDEAVRDLARKAGIAVDWTDAAGRPCQVSVPSLQSLLKALGFDCNSASDLAEAEQRIAVQRSQRPLLTTTVGRPALAPDVQDKMRAGELLLEDGTSVPIKLKSNGHGAVVPAIRVPGYHTLRYGNREICLAVAPARCVTASDIAPMKMWGVMAQLYSLRRANDGGIGDTGALAALAEQVARHGADAVTLSPAHSLFPNAPERYSPYSPSSRLFLNPLLADPAATFDEQRIAACQDEGSPDGALIDWPASAKSKESTLRRLFDSFTAEDDPADFETFVTRGGERLAAHARFEAADDKSPDAVRYRLFQQWVADRAFAAAQERAKSAGMKIGLITDLAVGIDRSGSEAATASRDLLSGLKIGAPPDVFNPAGQDWGLTTFSPHGLVTGGFETFIATLRAALRHAGGVRIDHAMGLMRLWLIPDGATAAEGAYLSYPLEDLLCLLALESHRHNAIVIGEDLGTVPPDFRKRCHKAGIAGMDVLWFQREERHFLPLRRWRRDAAAMTTTHDLPTAAGWWKSASDEDRSELWKTFVRAKAAKGPPPAPDDTAPAVDAAIDFVASAPCALALVPVEDIVGTTEQPNVPGTIDEHPNWRRRFDAPADELMTRPGPARRLELLHRRRP